MFGTLIDAATLRAVRTADWVIVDCRNDLADPHLGEAAYRLGHIPGARYAHLDRDLSGPPHTDRGRHPLPSPDRLAAVFGAWGIGPGSQVVAYDASAGMFAGRLWWLLQYMGHAAVAVLDGGWQAWSDAGFAQATDIPPEAAGRFAGQPHREWLVTLEDVAGQSLLVDSRDPPRYRGETEPLDPAAGHIPGALNRPFRANVDAQGRFRPAPDLRAEFQALLGTTPASQAAFYCGSGVSACHNLLALAHCGLGAARLYAGSWSEWCADPQRPIATGPAPGA